MSYGVGPATVRRYTPKEQVLEVFGGSQASSFEDTNTLPEQGKPQCIPTYVLVSLLYHCCRSSLCIYVLGVACSSRCIRVSFPVILVTFLLLHGVSHAVLR
jgi:hypothetical protein